MSQPSPRPESAGARFMRILRGEVGRTTRARAQRRGNATAPVAGNASSANASRDTRERFLRAFWTISAILSFGVNIVLIAILFSTLRMLGSVQLTANDKFSGLLGGLYINFLKMDEAAIKADVPVNDIIPLNMVVPVKTTTTVILAESATIPNARVKIDTDAIHLDAGAMITLPAGTPLKVALDFPLTVQNEVPLHLNVPVNIPLKSTDLHEPFNGLLQIIKPYYCLVEPNATFNNVSICSPFTQ